MKKDYDAGAERPDHEYYHSHILWEGHVTSLSLSLLTFQAERIILTF